MKRIGFLVLFLSSSFISCLSGSDDEMDLAGKWDVVWEEREQDIVKPVLEGEFQFLENGLVEITGYGYEGNPYLQEITQTTLYYYQAEDSIFTTQMGKQAGLNYKLLKLHPQNVVLQLTPEIYLNLSRKERE